MTELLLDKLTVSHGTATLLHSCSVRAAPGQMTVIVGPNGAGKTTLLRAIAALTPAGGQAVFGGALLANLSPVDRARKLAYLPQQHEFAWSMPVRAMVALGRYAFGDAADPHHPQVELALEQCGIAGLADRAVDRLSGGERALAALARQLCAETPLLLLDEPVAALDAGRQYQMLELLAARARDGATVLIILHDIALAAQFADRIWWMNEGHLIADTAACRDAIDTHCPVLFGRAPYWTEALDGRLLPYFAR